MSQLVQFVLLGLAAGSLYALTAHGLVLVYKSSGLLNLAQGAFGMVGAFLYYRVGDDHGWSSPTRWAVGLTVPALLGAGTHLLLLRRLRHASPLVRLVATLGVMFLLLAIANAAFGDTGQSVVSPLPHAIVHPFSASVTIAEDRLWLIAIALVLTAALSIVYRFTSFGRRTEAVASNTRGAAALGYSPDAIAAVNWALAGALAALTSILIAPALLLQPATLTLLVLSALAAALVGRFRSFWGTFAGALAIGVVGSLLARYVAHEGIFSALTSRAGLLFGLFSAQAVSRSVAFLVIVVAMTLGGRALPLRGDVLDRLPVVGDGRVRPLAVLASAACAAVAMVTVPDAWASALLVTGASAIVLLSIVLVTGYVGQLSLAQVALAGIGAWVAGRLVDAQGWPFPLAAAAGVAAAIAVGALVALPAIRTRGVNLAVLTFGLSICLVELVIANPALTGGLSGTDVSRWSFFGISLDPFDTPARYGLLVLAALTVCLLAVANVRRGRSGRRLVAVRGNERAAAALGIDVAGAKLYAFSLGAALAACGGILLAFSEHTIAYASFGTLPAIQSVVLAAIGGIGFVFGAVAGAVLAPGGVGDHLSATLGLSGSTLQIASGALLLATVVANPNGVVYGPVAAWRRLAARRRGRRPVHVAPALPPAAGAALRPAPKALRVERLSVRFGGVEALRDVSFELGPGEILGIIGPNGAGKTTLLDAITGLVGLAGGTVTLDGAPIERWPAHRRARAGLQRSFQSLELFEDLTVAENLLVACEPHVARAWLTDLVRPGVPALTPAAAVAVEEFALQDALDLLPPALSYGRRRLVAIARAAAAGPSLLALDEPAAGLGELESAELGALIRRLAGDYGIGIALIEHDMELVMSTCDRVVVLDEGRVIAHGRPAQVATDPAVVAAYLGEAPDGAVTEVAG
jgi:ABC-type branched-subunit amino acid transport system ATPase component/branched-subunit amino acid ABC-type transport system permease component